MRRVLLSVAAVTFVAGLAAVVTAPAALAASVESGWWYRFEAGGPVSVDTGVDGLLVERDELGEAAVAAVRGSATPGATVTAVTLTVADATGSVDLVACPPAADWEPARQGVWADRPEPDCAAATYPFTVDGDRVTIDVPDGSTFDVVVAPGAGSETFSVEFSVTTDAEVAETFPTTTTTTTTAPTTTTTPPATNAPTPIPTTPTTVGPTPVLTTPTTVESAPLPTVPGTTTTSTTVLADESAAPPTDPPGGSRSLAGIGVFALAAGAVVWRARAAAGAADDHPLAAGNVSFARVEDQP